MANLNKVLIIGNLTKDPELRYTPGGMAVVNLRVATNRRFKDKNGEQKEEVCFITAVVWDKQAEACNQYLRKGNPLFIEGRLQSRSWDAQDGSKRNVIEIRAERVQFLNVQKQQGKASDETDKPEGDGLTSDSQSHDFSEEAKEPEGNTGDSATTAPWPGSE